MYFPPSLPPGQALCPCRNAAGIVGYKTMRWQHGSDHITVPYRPRSEALHCRMVDLRPFEESHQRPLGYDPGTTIEKVNDEKNWDEAMPFPLMSSGMNLMARMPATISAPMRKKKDTVRRGE
ncbi:hypothetical protein TcG_04600 [Trypanosoma cruzi]|nr:hypothetical protein TcG_04600 [Trypanosoma cruzi]